MCLPEQNCSSQPNYYQHHHLPRKPSPSTTSLHLSASYTAYLLSTKMVNTTSTSPPRTSERPSDGTNPVANPSTVGTAGESTTVGAQGSINTEPYLLDSNLIDERLRRLNLGTNKTKSRRSYSSEMPFAHKPDKVSGSTATGPMLPTTSTVGQPHTQLPNSPPRSSTSSSSSTGNTGGHISPIQARNNNSPASSISPLSALQSARGLNRPMNHHFESAPTVPRANGPSASTSNASNSLETSSSTTSYSSTNLSAAAIIGGSISGTDVHAKLLDFQKSRQSRSRSNSASTGGLQPQLPLLGSRLSSQNSANSMTTNNSINTINTNINSINSTNTGMSGQGQGPEDSPLQPGLATPSSTTSDGSSPASPTPFSALAFPPTAATIQKVPSLSQRRGMKLNISQVSSPTLTNESPETDNDPSQPSLQLSSGSSRSSSSSSVLEMSGNSLANTSRGDDNSAASISTSTVGSVGAMGRTGSIRRNRPGTLSSAIAGGPPQLAGPGNTGLFDNYKRYVDIKTGTLNFKGKASVHANGIDFSSGSSFRISIDQFEPLGELGRGNYGTVTKVLHRPTNVVMAMKEIRLELDEQKFTQIIMELDILHSCVSPYIVDFFGAFFVEGAVYVCMENMDGGSLDKIYQGGIDEPYLRIITEAAVRGLKQLKEEHNIIHRDVKPTNILVSTSGTVKLCDFGVSGNLVASIARTNIGCQSYMAPERIRSFNPNQAMTYTVESDIWSLGLSILETALGSYPYPPETYENIFSQLSAIVDGDPPSLPTDKFSAEAIDFVEACLNKNARRRPTYAQLLQHPWLANVPEEHKNVDFGAFVASRLAKKSENEKSAPPKPALHTARPTDVAASRKP